jgi:uncharacterized protein (TIGR01777 family)
MRIVIAGGTGFIGEPLVRRLLARGDVAVVSRNPAHVRAGQGVSWDEAGSAVRDADVIINLAGENVGSGRWTEQRRRTILDSRLAATNALVDALLRAPARPRTFLSASAVGFYGPRGDEALDESAPSGDGFLADVVCRWEAAARKAEPAARTVILRFGVVLGRDGGALGKMIVPFRFGAGGPIGSGRQWMSWIDRDDAIALVEWAIDRNETRGVYNATAPQPVTNREFARALGRALHRPAFLPTPGFALRLAFGKMADEMLLAGQRVVPARATAEGFSFRYPGIDMAFAHAVS